MAAVFLQRYFPSLITYKYMLANIDMKKNEKNWLGEANIAPSRSEMAFTQQTVVDIIYPHMY